jgi:hypothetical protein
MIHEDTVTLICLCIFYGCFQTQQPQSWMVAWNSYHLAFYQNGMQVRWMHKHNFKIKWSKAVLFDWKSMGFESMEFESQLCYYQDADL